MADQQSSRSVNWQERKHRAWRCLLMWGLERSWGWMCHNGRSHSVVRVSVHRGTFKCVQVSKGNLVFQGSLALVECFIFNLSPVEAKQRYFGRARVCVLASSIINTFQEWRKRSICWRKFWDRVEHPLYYANELLKFGTIPGFSIYTVNLWWVNLDAIWWDDATTSTNGGKEKDAFRRMELEFVLFAEPKKLPCTIEMARNCLGVDKGIFQTTEKQDRVRQSNKTLKWKESTRWHSFFRVVRV